ncbi:MAG: hypothetical protein ACI9C1_003415 [Candidatus Aldehydirespiratoraceae bacterium]|jgi:hypothetical protein
MLIYTHVAEGNTVDDQDGRHDHGFGKSVNDARYRCGVFGINAPAGYEVRRELMSDNRVHTRPGDRERSRHHGTEHGLLRSERDGSSNPAAYEQSAALREVGQGSLDLLVVGDWESHPGR